MFVTLQEFFNNYRIQNGKQPNETVLNKGLMRLKREVRELESFSNIILGNPLPTWSDTTYYEVDEYIQYDPGTGIAFYKSLVSQNLNVAPGVEPAVFTVWDNLTDYAVSDVVINNGAYYTCAAINGPSTTVYEPGVTVGWETYWTFWGYDWNDYWENIVIDFADIRNILLTKADVATTLAGYGILDAYTQTQIDTLFTNLINGAPADFDTLGEIKTYVDAALALKSGIRPVPTTEYGVSGDKSGDRAIGITKDISNNITSIWIYFCFDDWTDGVNPIWVRMPIATDTANISWTV